jgi:hypothetical protein
MEEGKEKRRGAERGYRKRKWEEDKRCENAPAWSEACVAETVVLAPESQFQRTGVGARVVQMVAKGWRHRLQNEQVSWCCVFRDERQEASDLVIGPTINSTCPQATFHIGMAPFGNSRLTSALYAV